MPKHMRNLIHIPVAALAILMLVASSCASAKVRQYKVKVVKGAEGAGPFRALKGRVLCELQSGSYEFVVSN